MVVAKGGENLRGLRQLMFPLGPVVHGWVTSVKPLVVFVSQESIIDMLELKARTGRVAETRSDAHAS